GNGSWLHRGNNCNSKVLRSRASLENLLYIRGAIHLWYRIHRWYDILSFCCCIGFSKLLDLASHLATRTKRCWEIYWSSLRLTSYGYCRWSCTPTTLWSISTHYRYKSSVLGLFTVLFVYPVLCNFWT